MEDSQISNVKIKYFLNSLLIGPLVLSLYSILGVLFSSVEVFKLPFLAGMSLAAALSFLFYAALFFLRSSRRISKSVLFVFLSFAVVSPLLRIVDEVFSIGGFLPSFYLEILYQYSVVTAVNFCLLTLWLLLTFAKAHRSQILRILLLTVVFVLTSKNWVFLALHALELQKQTIYNLMSPQTTAAFSCLLIFAAIIEFKKITFAERSQKWKYLNNLRLTLSFISIFSVMFGIWIFSEAKGAFAVLGIQNFDADNFDVLSKVWQNYYINSVVLVMLLLAITVILLGLQTFSAHLEGENRKVLESGFNYFSQVYKSSPDAIITTNSSGLIEDVNDQFETIFGWRKPEIIGKDLSILIPEKFRANYATSIASYSENPSRRPMGLGLNLSGIRKNGEEFPVEISLGSINHDGRMFLLATVRDISKQKVVEERINFLNKTLEVKVNELEKANEEMKSFSYAISHDLRAPLRSIIGFSQIIQEDHMSSVSGELEDMLKRIVDSAGKMGMQIDGLLQLNRLSKKEIQKSMVSISSLAEDLVAMLLDESKKDKYVFEIQPNMMANCDLVLMRICLQNIFENAIKFSANVQSPKIKFYLSDPTKNVFCIEDNGIGFDSDKATKLFTIFHRLHSENEFPGLGIGLATVKKIIEIQGGNIWYESKLNQGAKFYFTLP